MQVPTYDLWPTHLCRKRRFLRRSKTSRRRRRRWRERMSASFCRSTLSNWWSEAIGTGLFKYLPCPLSPTKFCLPLSGFVKSHTNHPKLFRLSLSLSLKYQRTNTTSTRNLVSHIFSPSPNTYTNPHSNYESFKTQPTLIGVPLSLLGTPDLADRPM